MAFLDDSQIGETLEDVIPQGQGSDPIPGIDEKVFGCPVRQGRSYDRWPTNALAKRKHFGVAPDIIRNAIINANRSPCEIQLDDMFFEGSHADDPLQRIAQMFAKSFEFGAHNDPHL